MNQTQSSNMFVVAALFNWVVGLGLFFVPGPFLDLFSISPLPQQTLWVQQFAALVFFFGIGYFQASRDLAKMAPLIRLAIWAKWGVVVIGLYNIIMGTVSWQFMIPASADGVFAILFALALRSLPSK